MVTKKATTVDEQISLLESRKMKVTDKQKAKEILLDIGYYRLGFYWFPFEKTYPERGKKRSHEFVDGTRFEDAVGLYYFDYDIRKLLLPYLCRIEINLRTFVIYCVSRHYISNPLWFADSSVLDRDFVTHFQKSYLDSIKNNSAIKQHHKNHPKDLYAPAWKTLEYATFGDIIALCKSLKEKSIQKEIACHYGIRNIDVFFSFFDTVRVLRNLCAHGHNIFDLRLQKSIKRGMLSEIAGNECNNLSGAIRVVSYILSKISENRSVEMKKELSDLICKSRDAKFYSVVKYLETVSG